MPHPRDNAQQRGDIHPPEVEPDLPQQEGVADDASATEGPPGSRGTAAGRPAAAPRGHRKAGMPKEKDEG